MKKFSDWLTEEKQWNPKNAKMKSGAKCRRCDRVYLVNDLSDFFDGRHRCPYCGGQGDLVGNRKLQGLSSRDYPDDWRLSRLPGQEG